MRGGRVYPMVVEALATGTVVRQGDGALLERAAAMAAAAAGWPEKAEEHFATALRQSSELPHVLERPSVLLFWATFLIGGEGPTNRERARAMLTEARAGFRAVPMPRHRSMTEDLLRSL